ncbi:tripartite tricarboxylate transporter TctB family protein [Halopseudomonas pelagia]|uniref:tripartite tricarboxylate transporter TctB family protein n=1 Tax=Halopseudomonas pelagia TaxID=553151 RepID=UPI0003A1EE1B|nr:tripartite tricarboxylate transporter TctB family protein [Halopseudomonas pelagia]|tara:strand:+ start:97247 stop:97705 length:459 start_codon:yes stop_codon:yes gene_type:complete
MLYHRLFAACLLLACIGLGLTAWGYHAPYSYEPVGPRAYPLMLLVLLGAGALLLVFKPALESNGEAPPALVPAMLVKVLICLALLLALAALFEKVGFIVTATLFGFGMALLFGGRWLPSAILAVVLGIGLYFLFDRILDVPLPMGVLSVLEN